MGFDSFFSGSLISTFLHRSGKLSVDEISAHLKKMGMRQAEPAHIRALIGMYDDGDMDGELDQEEFLHMMLNHETKVP